MFKKGDVVEYKGRRGVVIRTAFLVSDSVVVKFDDSPKAQAFFGPDVKGIAKVVVA